MHLLGVIAFQAGRNDVAVETIRRAIALNGTEALFHNSLGAAHRALGRAPEAIACYCRALELKPDYAEAHYNLANALKQQGKLEEAVFCYRRALQLAPASAAAHSNLGTALTEQGKLDEAIACCRRALQLKPDFAGAHYNLGNALKDQGQLDEAAASYRRALELTPGHAEAHYNLGLALKELGKLDEAIACYHRALQWKPDYAEAHHNLGNALKEQGKLDEAIACHRRALQWKPDYVAAHNNLGAALNLQDKLDEAVACYRRALELKADYAEAHYNLGSVSEQQGDLAAAEDSFRAALRHNSRFAFAHYKLAMLLGGKLPEEDLAAQRRLLEETGLADGQRSLLHFGLAKVLDARGEYARAARHADQGNALQQAEWRRHGQQYDPAGHASFVTRMIEVSTPEFFQRVGGFGSQSELPVFIVGLPRSGTTLIEQVLAGHSQVFGAGETSLASETMAALGGQGVEAIEGLGRLDRRTAARLASRHLDRLRAFDGTALRIVDKMPENYLYLGLLASLFPRAKYVHCRRDLRDVAVSCWMTRFEKVRWANDQQQIASRFQEYQRLMAYWREVLPVPLLEVDYEETVADLEGVARKLVAWCGMAWEPGCLEFQRAKRPVRTASAVEVRQPVFRTSVGRWRHYQQALEGLFARIAPCTPCTPCTPHAPREDVR
jgi:tetratricopeptide (TPR) repeat protein